MIFSELFRDILKFFFTSILFIGLIVWTLQAINYFDFVTEDGHGLKVYFIYTILNFPKIINRLTPFIFFITIFYTLISYELRNELSIFWFNGITKINFMNKILIFSVILMFFQIFTGSYLSPKFQLEARNYLKNSDINFFSSLIKEGKFINVVKDLTIFIDNKNQDGSFDNIFIDDSTKNIKRMIYADKGYLVDEKNKKFFKLFKGKVININNSKINVFEFDQINFDLKNFDSNTITVPKIQEIGSKKLLSCFLNINAAEYQSFKCDKSIENEVLTELLKRFVKPLYIPLIAILSCFVILKSKFHLTYKKNNNLIFLITFLAIILSEVLLRYSSDLKFQFITYLLVPIFIMIFSYIIFTKRSQNV